MKIKILPTAAMIALTVFLFGGAGPALSQDNTADSGMVIKSIYLTGPAAVRQNYINYVIALKNKSAINSVIIDIKDYQGRVLYKTGVPEVLKYNARYPVIKDIDALIKTLHDQHIYVIARIVVFQDSMLAAARPDLAIRSKSKNASWQDNSGLMWVDPASKEVQDYNVSIAKDALSHGFDEINFDYVRFPSDGSLSDMVFPFWDHKTARSEVINNFFQNIRQAMPEAKLSVDLFGLTTVSNNDLGIGQIIENAFNYFDYVCPMVYPSHYADGFLGYASPASYPYQIITYSMEHALMKLDAFKKKTGKTNVYLRPWLQDFNLKGVDYNAGTLKLEMQAVTDSLPGGNYTGFMIWNPENIYHL